jgi:hypothetical protein
VWCRIYEGVRQSRSAFPDDQATHAHLHMLTLCLLVQPVSYRVDYMQYKTKDDSV